MTSETLWVRVPPCRFYTPVAQWTEHTATNRGVKSSNLFGSAKKRWQSGRLHRIANPEILKDPEVRIFHASFIFFGCSRSAGGAAVLKTASPKGYADSNPVCSVSIIFRPEGRIFSVFLQIVHIKNMNTNIFEISSIYLRKLQNPQLFSTKYPLF